jgi:hypothetical protein
VSKEIIRREWWRYEFVVTIEMFRDLAGSLEELLKDMVADQLRPSGGMGDPDIRIWRVRPSGIDGAFKLVLQGSSMRRVRG